MHEVVCNGDDELLDGTPGKLSELSTGCGAIFTIDDDHWDVKMDNEGNVISRHRQAYCPHCGTATFVVEPT